MVASKRNGSKKISAKTTGKTARPRLLVFRSNRYTYAQIIDDQAGRTLVSVSEKELKGQGGTKVERAGKIGELIAQKAQKAKVKSVVLDRNGRKYHGRVRKLAETAREGGLVF